MTALMVAARADYWSVVDVIIKHEYLQILRQHVRRTLLVVRTTIARTIMLCL